MLFFFSSRRRHTRYVRDWSSDVCSSDLGYARDVYIVTSGEKMALYAAANIGTAVEQFKRRSYARLGGIILNRRNVAGEEARVQELAEEFGVSVIASIERSGTVQEAEAMNMTVVEAFGIAAPAGITASDPILFFSEFWVKSSVLSQERTERTELES